MAEGDEITTGQVVGLIEAMKLFNEIKSDVSGTVTRALVESGDAGQTQAAPVRGQSGMTPANQPTTR